MSNTITAYFKGRIGVAESVYQNDYGIVMAFDSIDLPAHFDCYFSRLNQEEALPGLGADNRVTIPNSILANPGNVTIHIPLHTGEDDSEVEYVIYFKVIGRARPIDDGTPAQMTAIERALALLSQPITNIEEIVNEALSFTGDTFAEMKQELQDDFDEYTETLEGDLATWKGGVESDIDDVEADFDVLQGQFDTAVAAVTTDTEVTDIRVGADGVTDTTAGASVRRQFTDVKSEISNHPIGYSDIVSSLVDSKLLQKTVDNASRYQYDSNTVTLPAGEYLIAVYDIVLPSVGYFTGGTTLHTDDVLKQVTSAGTYRFSLTEETTVIWKMQVNEATYVDAGTYRLRYSVYDASTEIIPKYTTGVDVVENQKLDKIHSKNLFDKTDPECLDDYYVLPTGEINRNAYTSAFFVSGYVPVEPNKPYSISPEMHSDPISIAFYNSAKIFISYYQYNTEGRSYNLMSPDGAAFARFTGFVANKDHTMFEQSSSITDFVPYSDYLPVSILDARVSILENVVQTDFNEVSAAEVASLASGESIELTVPDIKQNNQISFYARLGSFDTIKIGHGLTAGWSSGYVVIDSTTIKAYQYTTMAVMTQSYNHGLSFADFISVIVHVKDSLNAEVTITTGNGGKYKCDISWNGNYGDVTATLNGGSLTKCGLTFTCFDYKKDVWAFGDSYFDMWPQIINAEGADNWLLDGYSGRGSVDAYSSLTKALQHGHPRAILWCLGMNNGDSSSAINSTWKNTVDNLIALCNTQGIELILATVPTTPNVNNNFKNAYVKASGKRYVDICEAVGADVSSSWYTGLLSGDNVHPTNKGSQAIAYRVMSDVPEIMY